MELAVPLPDMGRNHLEQIKARYLDLPGAALVLAHAGMVKAVNVPEILDAAESFSRKRNDPTALRKRLMHVVVEAVDNLCRHALGILSDSSFVLLVHDSGGYHLATGNAVPSATAAQLVQRVEILNAMPAGDLKTQYMKILAFNGRSRNGGAGLGLLTMARKAIKPILLETSRLGPFTTYLTMDVRVGPEAGSPAPEAA
jgi:hypothetical protein